MTDTTLPAILDRIRTGMATAEDADRIEAMVGAATTPCSPYHPHPQHSQEMPELAG